MTDSATGNPLSFVNIIEITSGKGMVTDIDGHFSLKNIFPDDTLQISFVGYQTKTIPGRELQGKRFLSVSMDKRSYSIPEIDIYPGENPAHKIIRKAIENKKNNDPENRENFSYYAYNKMVFSIIPGSISLIDSLGISTRPSNTNKLSVREFAATRHLMVMESVSKRTFSGKGQDHEEVLASNISGINDPILSYIAREYQSFSFYKNFITVAGKEYVNPLSRGSEKKYFFLLTDTFLTALSDTVYVISYKPRNKQVFASLEGIMHINTRGYALQNVLASPTGNDGFYKPEIQQLYKLEDDGTWFPAQLNTRLEFLNPFSTSSGENFYIEGSGKSYISKRKINTGNTQKIPPWYLSFSPDVDQAPDSLWKKYRYTPLSRKELNTYLYMDSISGSLDLERRINSMKGIMQGYIPAGFLDIELNSLLGYNEYEGIRLGVGGRTNNRLSKYFSTGGHVAWGTRDHVFKYRVFTSFHFPASREGELSFSYQDDLAETGGIRFLEEINTLLPESFRSFLISEMHQLRQYEMGYSFRVFRDLKTSLSFSDNQVKTGEHYYFNDVSAPENAFSFNEIGLKLRYSYKEKLWKSPEGKIMSNGSRFPVVFFNYKKGVPLGKNVFNYDKYEIKIVDNLPFKYAGNLNVVLMAGLVEENLPLPFLFNGHGSFAPFTLDAPNSFATMHPQEFYHNRFAFLFLKHNFGKIFRSEGIFQPELEIAYNMGIGRLDYPDSHMNKNMKSMDPGYLESGILIPKILHQHFSSYGIGFFYRHGPHAFSNFMDNMAIRLVFSVNL